MNNVSNSPFSRTAPLLACAGVTWLLYFIFSFLRDSYEELFINPVHFFDDAYMFIRYARIWHLGYGESWNIGQGPVYGNTSQLHFLFVLLLTSFQSLDNEMVIKLSSYIPSALLMVWLPWFCARHALFLSDKSPGYRLLFWVATVCPFLYWATPYAYHFLTGMDTALSVLLHLLLIDAVLSLGQEPVMRVSLRACGLIVLLLLLGFETRPESILPDGLFVLLYFSLVLRQQKRAVIVLAVTAAVLAIDALFKWHYFGDFVPLAFYSKKVDYLEGFAAYVANHPLLGVSHFLVMIWPLFALTLLGYERSRWRFVVALSVPVLLITLYFLTMMSIMNIRLRYEYPYVIYLIALLIVVFPGFPELDRRVLWRRAVAAAGIFVLLFMLKLYSAQIVRLTMKPNPLCDMSMLDSPVSIDRDKYKGNDGLRQMSDYLHELPAGTRIVMTEHGYVGANNLHINIIDVIGLHNHVIAHQGFSVDWMLAQQPDAIWVPHWNYTCLNQRIFNRPDFWKEYELYPLVFNWGFALRKDSQRYALMQSALARKVAELYPGVTLEMIRQTAPKVSN